MARPLPFRPSPFLLAGLAIFLLFALGIGNRGLWGYHEPYVGGIIREMAASGDFVVPTLNGRPYLEKPPLFYALGAVVCRALGTFHPWALRLPSALLALGTSLWAGFLARRLGCARGAAWAAFPLATSFLFFEIGQTAVVDMALTAAGGFPWVLAQEADFSPWLAGAMTGAAAAFTLGAWIRLRRGDAAGAFHSVMVHWTLFLALLLAFGVPAMDREDWSPLQGPYRQALALRENGAMLAAAGLTETQLGHASLTLHQALPELEGPAELAALLAQDRPVAVLVERELWARAVAQGVRGTEVPTEADGLPAGRRGRAPVLVRN